MFEPHITKMVHGLIKDYITEGDIAIDATMGNGHDTIFLAEQVGKTGKVYAFDIQDTALYLTKEKLVERNLFDRVTLIKDSHEKVTSYVEEPINLAMFNLGYLPRGDKKLITKPSSTLSAIERILRMMKKDGMLSIVAYYGHNGGMEEKDAVRDYVRELEQRQYEVISIQYENRNNYPPIIYLVKKR